MSWWSDLISVFKPAPEPAAEPAPAVAVLQFTPAPKPELGAIAGDEQKMIRAIQSGDEHGRAIYADWLEDHGRTRDADYVRAELDLRAAEGKGVEVQRAALDRFHLAGRRVSTDLKAFVSRPAIEKCLSFALKCPRQWSELSLTGEARVRDCAVCRQQVRFCETVREAREVAEGGGCVAVELSRPRREGDLDDTRVMMVGKVAG